MTYIILYPVVNRSRFPRLSRAPAFWTQSSEGANRVKSEQDGHHEVCGAIPFQRKEGVLWRKRRCDAFIPRQISGTRSWPQRLVQLVLASCYTKVDAPPRLNA